MKKCLLIVLALSLAPSVFGQTTAPSASAGGSDNERFQQLAKTYIEAHLVANPEKATQLGDHRFDDVLTDYSHAARDRVLAAQKQFKIEANTFDASKLSQVNSVDLRILKDNIDKQIFVMEELKEEDWNPLVYMQSLANSLYLLVAREFDTPESRASSVVARMLAIPKVIEQARQNLQHPPKVHTETAIEQVQGAITFVREGLGPLLDEVPDRKKEVAPLQEKTAKALEDYKKWLQDDLLKRSDGDFRIGNDKFRKKLRFALASDLSMEEIMQRAKADLAQTQTKIYDTALPLYKKYF